ncbi:MAG: response regulator [Nitrospiraceae bacterium]
MSTVLVIDSQESVRCLIRHMLEPVGYEVVEAAHAQEALDIGGSRLFDIVMMDLVQPAKQGLDALMSIRRSFPQSKIVAMAGRALPTADMLETSRLFGAQATLLTPFAPDTLFKVLATLWRWRAAA